MEIKRGKDRFVILLPALGIVLKFPMIYVIKSGHNIKRMLASKTWLYNELFKWDVYVWASFKAWLFKGIFENWSEFIFYQKSKHTFLVPTYFSFFGLLNVQKLATPPLINDRDFLYQIATISQGKAYDHHYTNPNNFHYSDGKLQILDYGDPKVQKVVIEVGNLLQEKFDINTKCPHNGIISGS